jgi:hypothetical protein
MLATIQPLLNHLRKTEPGHTLTALEGAGARPSGRFKVRAKRASRISFGSANDEAA